MALPANLDALQLRRLQPTSDTQPADWVRHHNRRSYVLDAEGRLLSLNLCGCELKDASFLQSTDFQYLEALNLSENQLTELRLPAHLQALRVLNIGENAPLTQLVFEGPLPALETLVADECALESLQLPAGLDALHTLDLRKNKLSQVVFAAGCKKLSFLDLSQNQLKSLRLPKGFAELQYLYLNDNLLEEVEFDVAPRTLEVLHIRNNQLERLPHHFLSLTALQNLYLHGNPLPGIPKASLPEGERDNAFSSVRAFLQELSQGKRVNERAKIILVGNGRVGKTSMFRRLKGLPYRADEKFTHGIQLGDLAKNDLPKVKTPGLQANIWDFGGQEIFYATHQFFLTEDALYVLCWTSDENTCTYQDRDRDELPDEGKNQSREYWLENIRHRGGPDCPILMVQTHAEPDKATEALNAADILKEYQAVCLDFSAKTDKGLTDLKEKIAQKLNTQVSFFGEDVPESYDNLIAAIEGMNPGGTKISLDFFKQELCPAARVQNGNEIEALHFLRKTGTVVWFWEDKALSDTIFVNPNWLTQQVYRLINRKLAACRGRIDPKYLAEVFSDFSPEERSQFLELLKKFKLIFETKEEEEAIYIAPQYLPAEPTPETQKALRIIEKDLKRAFIFAFPKFMPDNVMINFLSHYGPFSENLYWKNGICFQNQQDQTCIVRLLDSNRLEVLTEPGEKAFALQAEVCRAFVDLSKKANAEIILDGHRVSWQKMLKARRDGLTIMYDEDENPVETALFDPFFSHYALEVETGAFMIKGEEVSMERGSHHKSDGPTPTPPMTPPPPQTAKPKIYFSFSWGDPEETDESREKIVDELYESLKKEGFDVRRDKMNLEYGRLITDFMKSIGQGDLIIVCVSEKYLKSVYCMWELCEIHRNTLGEKEKFIQRIIPVRIEDLGLDKPKNLGNYMRHWNDYYKDWDEYFQEFRGQTNGPDWEAFQKARVIRDKFSEVAGHFQDMNAKTKALLRKNDFEIVKKIIYERTQKLSEAS